MNHKHDHCCEHMHLAYCKVCQVVYCKDCNREWRDEPAWRWYSTPYFTSTGVYSTDSTAGADPNVVRPSVTSHVHG
jgi:hypothetical protein